MTTRARSKHLLQMDVCPEGEQGPFVSSPLHKLSAQIQEMTERLDEIHEMLAELVEQIAEARRYRD
jgi:hypothetical protein